jgi:3-phytase
MQKQLPTAAVLLALTGCASVDTQVDVDARAQALSSPLVPAVSTPVLPSYDDAPRSVDADDPAIWVHPERPARGLVIAALKDAGLAVYDLSGALVQTIVPPARPPLGPDDPPAPGPRPDLGTAACPESESGETYGRFNNVDVQYGVRLRDRSGKLRSYDVAVVTDRGCDRLRIYGIDPERSDGPLFDLTDPAAPRVFPKRFVNPWSLAESAAAHLEDNPLDDQSTAYGLALYTHRKGAPVVFVTQRSRANVAQLELVDTGRGTLSYRRVRELRFSPDFTLGRGASRYSWTPCREDAADDPQFEGLVVDQQNGILYAAQEVVGIWKLPIAALVGRVVDVPPSALVEPVRTFGQPYWAIPDDGEYACEQEPPSADVLGALVQPGSDAFAGAHLTPDAEGLAIYYGRSAREGYLIASSQGDDTFHVFARSGGFSRASANRHVGAFTVAGAGETDGHEVVNVPMGRAFPEGLFVLQNGKASEEGFAPEINGYELDGATQFMFVGWGSIARQLGLSITPRGYDPR